MLDNLRDSASSSFFDDDDDDLPDFLEEEEKETPVISKKRRTSGPFLGLSPMQRFMLSAMLFFTICVIGTLFVLVFGRVMLPAF